MGAAAPAHPTDQILQSYGLGKLDDRSAESVNAHLKSCPDCQSRVAELSSDSFLGRLRNAQGQADNATAGWAHSSLSQDDHGPAVAFSPPPANTMPPGLADHPDYEVVKELGRGGMGVVYLAYNRLMGRNEVLKVMSSHIIERPGVLSRFLAEIRAVGRLQHPNIVTAYSAFRQGESIIFAMEYVEGLDLAKMVKSKGPLPVAHACHFVHQAAQGMQHAHDRGMVHRDIKPANLMLSHKGGRPLVKVLDFGLARATREVPVDGGLTNPGQALGTPDYMAPEQIRDAQKADIRADVYSLGCTLYYLLSGGPPFRADNLWDLYQAHHSMDAKLLNFVRPEVPGELAALVAKMMAKEPDRRFQTPSEVAQALAPFFKRANGNVGVLNLEVSQAGPAQLRPEAHARDSMANQPAKRPTAVRAPRAEKPGPPAGPEARWESLIELEDAEPLRAPARPPITKVIEKPKWLWPAAAAGLLLLLLLGAWAAFGVRVNTPRGTIVLENVPDDADVEVDGEKITVAPAAGEPLTIEVAAGKHGVLVKRGEDLVLGEFVTVQSGKQFKLTARLEPPAVKRPERDESTATKASSPEVSPPRQDRTRFTVLAGKWERQGDELVQADVSKWTSAITFGDDQWTDYDFTADAMRIGGTGLFSLYFRSTFWGNELEYEVSGEENKTCNAVARLQGVTRLLRSYNFSIQNRTWYTARVRVRGGHIVCSIYDSSNATETRVFDFSDEGHPRGRVGLRTFGSAFRFKNIKVTAPDGRVLWDGVPAVASVIEPGPAKLADHTKPSAPGPDGFGQLFKGIDLTGWKTHPQQRGNWHVENGILVGSGPLPISHLYTIRGDYKDFHLRAQVRIGDVGNGGLYFRSPFGPSWPANDRRFPAGYEAQIYSKPGDRNFTGSLFVGDRGAVVPVNTLVVRPFEWCTLEVIARENHLVIKVNDKTTADYNDRERFFSSGHIALQQNGPQTTVEFRKIEIKELGGNTRRTDTGKTLDAFRPGTVWAGENVRMFAGKRQVYAVTYRVLERQGERFRIRVEGPNNIRDVQGTIIGRQIKWLAKDVIVIKGHQGLDVAGTIEGEQVTLHYSGIAEAIGAPETGTIKLRLQE
jgi:serine/threonine protein kinase